MKKRVDVHGSEQEFEAWKGAAGDVPLGRWARRVLNQAAERAKDAPAMAEVLESAAAYGRAMSRSAELTKPFKPDFGSRLKGGKK